MATGSSSPATASAGPMPEDASRAQAKGTKVRPTEANPRSWGRFLLGFLALCSLPLLVLIDTVLSESYLESPQRFGALALIPLLAMLALFVWVVLSISKRFRNAVHDAAPKLWLASVSLLVGLLLAEALLAWYPQAPYHCRPPNDVYTYNPDPFLLPGVVGPATSTINSVGVRGAEIPANEATLRILCVGGTSTESPYLDDAECWPTLLARDLTKQLGRDVWVGSVGFGSYGLDEHREFLANSDLIDQVDCIVVMPGMNDFLSSVLGLGEPEGGPLWSQLHSLDVAREVWNGRLGNGCVCDPQGETWTMFRLGQPIPEISVDDAVAVKSFHKKLEQLVLAAQARDKPLVLVTQAVLWKRFLSEPGERRLLYARQYPLPRDWELLAPGSLATLFTQFNEQIHEVVNQNPHVGLIDVAAILDGNERAFYDDYHFNEYGSQECAAIISNWFAASRRRHSP